MMYSLSVTELRYSPSALLSELSTPEHPRMSKAGSRLRRIEHNEHNFELFLPSHLCVPKVPSETRATKTRGNQLCVPTAVNFSHHSTHRHPTHTRLKLYHSPSLESCPPRKSHRSRRNLLGKETTPVSRFRQRTGSLTRHKMLTVDVWGRQKHTLPPPETKLALENRHDARGEQHGGVFIHQEP